MESIIKVKNVGKKYNIRHFQGGYVALRDVLMDILKNPLRFLKKKAKDVAGISTKEDFWALKGVNFEVKAGKVIGIIGRNGAGKSTLLKILTGITPPTTGEIVMHGRVASLLEVGTGFHPELTGRENIFLNGAILGMKKSEIAKNFDSIVEFAEIEKFLDTPVKYYSSGMYVRLAFSVAAHMEPDILLVDEVLAVGDTEFQKKCLGKMEEVTKKQGRTILFVSHNMAAIERICNRCILIEKGHVKKDSTDVREVIKEYLHSTEGATENSYWLNPNNGRFENDWWKPLEIYLSDKNGRPCDASVRNDSRVELVIKG
ncbi:MAG TPA: ABC transporter ATP-binding protein, partial [Candidatus Paceibacterota bacterium]